MKLLQTRNLSHLRGVLHPDEAPSSTVLEDGTIVHSLPRPWAWPFTLEDALDGGGTIHRVSYDHAERFLQGYPVLVYPHGQSWPEQLRVKFVREVADVGPYYGPDVSAAEVLRRHGFPCRDTFRWAQGVSP